jgi:DNA phosphorothioation-associated putative methyltransferase
MSALPIGLRRDIRAFFGTYSAGCRRADDLLFRAGDADAVDDACRRSAVGKLLPDALYVHRTAPEALDPLLRADEGCARADLGEIEGADLIKLHRHSGQVSHLVDPDFDADPHPALLRSIELDLRTREIESTDYAAGANPPVLHRKEALLLPDDPRWSKFDRLTRQEERAGLLDETATIGTRSRWADRLRGWRYTLRGHRLVRSRGD